MSARVREPADGRSRSMSPAYVFNYNNPRIELRDDNKPIPVPPGNEKPPIEEPPDGPVPKPDTPIQEPDPVEPQRLGAVI